MGSKARLLDLMRRREALGARKAAAGVGALSAEQARNTDLAARLEGLIAQTLPGSASLHPSQLRAAMTLAAQLETQREIATNRADFLTGEIAAARTRLMRHQRRETMIAERATEARSAEAVATEARLEAAAPPRKGRPTR